MKFFRYVFMISALCCSSHTLDAMFARSFAAMAKKMPKARFAAPMFRAAQLGQKGYKTESNNNKRNFGSGIAAMAVFGVVGAALPELDPDDYKASDYRRTRVIEVQQVLAFCNKDLLKKALTIETQEQLNGVLAEYHNNNHRPLVEYGGTCNCNPLVDAFNDYQYLSTQLQKAKSLIHKLKHDFGWDDAQLREFDITSPSDELLKKLSNILFVIQKHPDYNRQRITSNIVNSNITVISRR